MNLRNELKSIISKKGTSFKKICQVISKNTNNPQFNSNNVSSKISRGTVRFEEIQLILKELGYRIEFVEDN